MSHTAFLARINGLLSVIDSASDTLAIESMAVIQGDAKTLSCEQLFELAREYCVFAKPRATEALRPIIQVELALMNHPDLWRLARRNNGNYLEEMICEELKLRTELTLRVLSKIANHFRSNDVRDEFERWVRQERR